MGCFDVTCPISGLAIHHDDPIRFALITESNPSSRDCGVCASWQFWTPCFHGIYNDYGSTDYKNIKPKPLWNWIMEYMIPGMMPLLDYPQYATTSKKPEIIFSDLVTDRRVYDPHRDQKGYHVSRKMQLWMVHEWAFDHIKNIECENILVIKTQAQNYVKMHDIDFASRMFNEFYQVEGSDGVLHPEVRWDYMDRKNPFADEYRDFLIETARFTQGLHHVRKTIQVPGHNGEQYEGYEKLLPWTKLVYEKVLEQVNKMED